MGNQIINNQDMTETVRIGRVKNLEMQDFIETLTMLNCHSASYFDGFYTITLGTTYQQDPTLNAILFVVPAVYFTGGDYYRYIVINTSNFSFELKEQLGELRPNAHIVQVTKYESYERANLDNCILEKMKHIETLRNAQLPIGGVNTV